MPSIPNPATTPWVPIGPGGLPLPVVNGQWLKGVGGAAVWSAITPADAGLPKITSSAMSGGPPASPANGDIWNAQQVLTQTGGTYLTWQFQWESAFSVWRFIGGPPVHYESTASQTVGAINTWTSLNPTITLARTGHYVARMGGRMVGGGTDFTNSFWISIGVNNLAGQSTGIQYHAPGSTSVGVFTEAYFNLAAGATLRPAVYMVDIRYNLVYVTLEVMPVFIQ